jgi:ribosome-associated heat shock protein Hsp15
MNVKPSHNIKVGDVIEVRKPPVTFTFEVVGLLNNRVGAKLVPNYLKNITPEDQYKILEMARIGGFVRRQKGMGRPTKKEGREMAAFADEAFLDFDDFDDENPFWTEEDEEKLESKK